ncbi:MAG: FAD binding domain-containing protein [Desulfobacterota bacterium]|nr:FAD binding domain-containing protein [Thermodesulfobacteriota bacterium]
MRPFRHINAKTVEEALKLLLEHRGRAKLIGGGTDLIPILRRDSLSCYPEVIINIKTIPGLDYIKEEKDCIRIGALTKLADIASSPVIKRNFKILSEAAFSVGTPQIRNMATIAGNLCQDVRCWYYRYPHQIGGRITCYLKGGKTCYALVGDNRYHSVFECYREQKRPSACTISCPAEIDIPSYLAKLRLEDLNEAARILYETNPLPSITGRVCPHYCEKDCTKGYLDESVAIRSLERFLGDYALGKAEEILKIEKPESGKTVAIVGSGPCGLTSAYYLRRFGHDVTIFEKDAEPGGLLRYGIPSFRLPKKIVDDVIYVFQKVLGIRFKTNTEIGKDISIYELMTKFDAVLVAVGAYKEIRMNIPGEELVISGIDFLRRVNSGSKEVPGSHVAVIGGGNVAIDVARVLLRLGANPVIIYRRSEKELPALSEEVEAAKEEGIRFEFLTLPIAVQKKEGKISLTCVKMELKEKDETGRPKPVPIEGSEFTLEFDAVIKAIGEIPSVDFVPEEFLDEKRMIKAERITGHVARNLFAGGDCVLGPATVVEAVAMGRRVAFAIDKMLSGERKDVREIRTDFLFDRVNVPGFKASKRIKVPRLEIHERNLEREDIGETSIEDLKYEVTRCINCGCVAVNPSDVACALMALDAKIKLIGEAGEMVVSMEEFFQSPRGRLSDTEIITEILIPPLDGRARQSFVKFRLRDSIDFSIVTLSYVATFSGDTVNDIRIVLGSVSPRPIRARFAEEFLRGKALNDKTIEALAEMISSSASPLPMNGFKIKVLNSLLRRALLSELNPEG